MTSRRTELIVPTHDGHTATLSYALSDTQGWDVRAQIDDQVLTRHCYNWRGVERFYEWLRMAPAVALRGAIHDQNPRCHFSYRAGIRR